MPATVTAAALLAALPVVWRAVAAAGEEASLERLAKVHIYI